MLHQDRPIQSESTWAAATVLTATLAVFSILALSTGSTLSQILLESLKYGWVGGFLLLVGLFYVLARRRVPAHLDLLVCKMLVGMLGYFLLVVAFATFVLHFYETTALIPVSLVTMAAASLLLSGYLSGPRPLLRVIGCVCLVLTALSAFGNWLPQVEGGFPPQEFKFKRDVYSMTPLQLADEGEKIIFGGIGQSKVQGAIGRGQCPLCHSFVKGLLSFRAPNLWGVSARKRLHKTSIEYIAESHVCPSCYVVGGFGVRGTENRESPMPKIHKPPISLSLEELIAVDTWIFVNEGEIPPPPEVIRAAYLKADPISVWPSPRREDWEPSLASVGASSGMSHETIFKASLCASCHVIPGIQDAVGKRGPALSFPPGTPRRIDAEDYEGRALTFREYLEEAILNHNMDILPGYRPTLLPENFFKRNLSAGAVHKMMDYLERESEGDPALPAR